MPDTLEGDAAPQRMVLNNVRDFPIEIIVVQDQVYWPPALEQMRPSRHPTRDLIERQIYILQSVQFGPIGKITALDAVMAEVDRFQFYQVVQTGN